MGLPIAREGSPRLRAFSPRGREWPLVAAVVSLVAAGAVGSASLFFRFAGYGFGK